MVVANPMTDTVEHMNETILHMLHILELVQEVLPPNRAAGINLLSWALEERGMRHEEQASDNAWKNFLRWCVNAAMALGEPRIEKRGLTSTMSYHITEAGREYLAEHMTPDVERWSGQFDRYRPEEIE